MVSSTKKPVLATCKWCDKTFNVRLSKIATGQVYCSVPCATAKQRGKQRPYPAPRLRLMTTPGVDPKHYGALAEIMACEWLIRQGYDLFRNISQHGLADFVAWRVGEAPVLIDVKGFAIKRGTAAQKAAGVRMLYVDRATRTVSFNLEDFGHRSGPRDYRAAYQLGVERQKALAGLPPDPSSPSPAIPCDP